MIMTDEQKLKYDLLEKCGYDMDDKAQSKEITPASFAVFGVTEGFIRMTFRGVYNYLGGKGGSDDDFTLIHAADVDAYNFMGKNGKLLTDTWFYDARDFHEGFARVQVISGGTWDFIDTKGRYLSAAGFDAAGDFHEGFAIVILGGKYNFIDTEGKLISDTWYDCAWCFIDDYALVKLKGEYFYIDKQGKRMQ